MALAAVSQPPRLELIGDGPVADPRPPGRSECWRFRVEPPAQPAALVAAWEEALRRGDSAVWLLERVSGSDEVALGLAEHARGLRVEQGRLVICVAQPTPDWGQRLRHPGLWAEGDGPFRWVAEGQVLVRTDDRASIERVEFLQAADDLPDSMLRSGRADMSVVYGGVADRLLRNPGSALRVQRLPEWDRIYALWINPESRWVNDPRFRAWLAETIDRDTLLNYLFGGRGESARRLLPTDREPRVRDRSPRRPFAAGSVPRLTLGFDVDDPYAGSIAARIKAVAEQEGVALELEPRSPAERRRAWLDGRYQLSIVVHHPPVDDPVLALQDTLWSLGPAAEETLRQLDRASRIEAPDRRHRRAVEAEDRLLDDGRLVPLVRLFAWLAVERRLEGVQPGAYGVLRMESAEWKR